MRSERLLEPRPKTSYIQEQQHDGKWKFCVRKQGEDLRSTTILLMAQLVLTTDQTVNRVTVSGKTEVEM